MAYSTWCNLPCGLHVAASLSAHNQPLFARYKDIPYIFRNMVMGDAAHSQQHRQWSNDLHLLARADAASRRRLQADQCRLCTIICWWPTRFELNVNRPHNWLVFKYLRIAYKLRPYKPLSQTDENEFTTLCEDEKDENIGIPYSIYF